MSPRLPNPGSLNLHLMATGSKPEWFVSVLCLANIALNVVFPAFRSFTCSFEWPYHFLSKSACHLLPRKYKPNRPKGTLRIFFFVKLRFNDVYIATTFEIDRRFPHGVTTPIASSEIKEKSTCHLRLLKSRLSLQIAHTFQSKADNQIAALKLDD